MNPTADDIHRARGDLIRAIATLTASALSTPTLAARNLIYHAEELMRCLDAFQSGRELGHETDDVAP